MALLQAFRSALSGGIGEFRRQYDNPAAVEGGAELQSRSAYFRFLWSMYDASAFENMALWSRYRARHRLYRQMRTIYNPTRRLVDFYAGQVYPGVLSEDGAALPDGVDIAIPLADDTPPQIRAALGQFWRWSNWQARKGVFVRFGAATGNVLVELEDDLDAGRVSARVVWPGLVSWLDLSPAGDIKEYALQYEATDDKGMRYVYRKEVDANEFRTYRDGKPYAIDGEPAAWDNPYGFVPAVWVQHRHIGGTYGAPAIYGSIPKVDELNSLAAHVHDQVHKVIGAPLLFSSDAPPQSLFKPQNQGKRPPSNEFDLTDIDREGVLMLTAPKDSKVSTLAGSLPLTEALGVMQALMAEIEADHPEITMYRQLRGMSQVTGPAASRLMGDVAMAVNEVAANYDSASVSIFGMALAMGGYRANRGDWGPLTAHQKVFTPFGLDSYSAGDLDMAISPRPLVAVTALEAVQLDQARTALEQQKQDLAASKAAPPAPVAASTLISVKEQ